MLDALHNHRAVGFVILPDQIFDRKLFTMRMGVENNPI
jgi:hypothetical protein